MIIQEDFQTCKRLLGFPNSLETNLEAGVLLSLFRKHLTSAS
ncbi:hypothetical protein SOVF_100320 [Spinacia oleracea]|nr:hypothetical protein SOVF_100320 [Spinacia oleracea]